MRRVVVTGMGVISPVGNDLESFWNNLTEGKNGVGMITRFDTTEQKVKVAAEVKDFEPTKYIEKSQVISQVAASQSVLMHRDQIFQLLPHVQLPPMQSEKPSMQSVMDMLMPSSPAVQKLQSMRLLSQVLQTAKH